MTVELWIALFAALAIGATVGFVFAKHNAPKKSELDALRDQLHAAQTETAEIREGVSDHFEQSAVLFGRLAQDYRSFIEHFSESAQTLGISEGHARELLEQASQPLVSHDVADTDAIEGATVTSIADSDAAVETETSTADDSAVSAPESTPAVADDADAESTAAESAAAESAVADSAVADSSSRPTSDEVTADADERAELSADITPDSADAEPITEDIVAIDEQAESSVAEVDFETPEQDKIAEQKAG